MNTKFSIKKEHTGGHWLTVIGNLTVQNSQSLKENLIKLLAHEDQTTVSLQAVESVDMAGIQLLFAFHKVSKDSGRASAIIWPDNKEVDGLLEKAGIKSVFGS
jgi:anti-anti-sigma regulatory factor